MPGGNAAKSSLRRIAVGAAVVVALAAVGVGLTAFAGSSSSPKGQTMPNMAMGDTTAESEGMGGMDMGGETTEGMEGMDMGGETSTLPEMQMAKVTRMGELVMPPGMIMTAGTPMDAMRDMAAVDRDEIDFEAPAGARGDQPLQPERDGAVKVFRLTASVTGWRILPGTPVAAYAFNRQVPGPRLELTEGDRVRIVVRNDLPEPTTVHWHGLVVPNGMDGPADVTQEPIPPGGSFTYEFTAEQAGTFFYHSHKAADRQQALGLYGALVVAPKNGGAEPQVDQDVVVQLGEWTVREGYTFPSMPMEGLLPNFFTINGKAWPETQTIRAKVGDRIRFRFVGAGAFAHPMHIHGGPFEVVASDGNPVPAGARLLKDTINVSPGERWDVVWTARRAGKWLLHCHIAHHTTNDGAEVEGAGGLTMLIDVSR